MLVESEKTSGPIESDSKVLERQTDALSQWLFDAVKYLDKLQHIANSKEPFAARVARLKREGLISATLSALMQMLNTYRMQVVKERRFLADDERQIVSRGIAKCHSDWKKFS